MPIDPRISLQKLEVFCAVVRHGGVARAADHLYVSQPVVSAHLRSLQERIGSPLFRKEGRRLELTEAGQRVLAWAQEVLERTGDLGEDLSALAGGIAGAVTIGATMSVGNYLLPEVLVAFGRRFPRVRVSMPQATTEVMLSQVLDGDVDLGLISSGSSVHSPRLTTILLGRPELVVVAATGSGFPDSMTAAELAEAPFVCPPAGSGVRDGQDAALAALGIRRRNVALEAGTAESIKTFVRSGLGLTLLSEMAVRDDLAAGVLRRINLDTDQLPDQLRDHLYLVHRQNKVFSPAQNELTQHLLAAVPGVIR